MYISHHVCKCHCFLVCRYVAVDLVAFPFKSSLEVLESAFLKDGGMFLHWHVCLSRG